MWSKHTRQLIEAACEEDLGPAGDLTSALLKDGALEVEGRVVVRAPGVICGLALGPAICEVFSRRLGRPLEFTAAPHPSGLYADGANVTPGTCVAHVRGPKAALLSLERTLLNFQGRMSGVATLTRRFVDAARQANPEVRILDTRKTLPGWRELDKYAVRAGGGHNHRFGLYDAVLIKDNHLAHIPLAGLVDELRAMLQHILRPGPATGLDPPLPSVRRPSFIEVEVDTPAQLAEVCKVDGVDIVLLDNFTPDALCAAVAHRDAAGLRGKLALEASGGIRLETVAAIAATGIDRISIGALTHSAAALDVALDI